MVRSIEAMGSSSGKTRQRVVIADCGELPSRRQILAKMAAEKEALANMKKDPLQVGQHHHSLIAHMKFVTISSQSLMRFRPAIRCTHEKLARCCISGVGIYACLLMCR